MHAFTRFLATGLCALAAVSAVQAQQPRRTIQAVAPTQGAASTGTAQPGAPAGTTGLGVRPELFPADVSPGSTPPGVAPPPGTMVLLPDGSTMVVPPAGLPNVARRVAPAVAVPDTTVLGAGVSCGASASDAVRNFLYADGDQDCQLTRAEATLLGPSARPFEEMDRNSDGVVTRAEFDASLR